MRFCVSFRAERGIRAIASDFTLKTTCLWHQILRFALNDTLGWGFLVKIERFFHSFHAFALEYPRHPNPTDFFI